jgi:hypothetical protein
MICSSHRQLAGSISPRAAPAPCEVEMPQIEESIAAAIVLILNGSIIASDRIWCDDYTPGVGREARSSRNAGVLRWDIPRLRDDVRQLIGGRESPRLLRPGCFRPTPGLATRPGPRRMTGSVRWAQPGRSSTSSAAIRRRRSASCLAASRRRSERTCFSSRSLFALS